MYAQKSHPKILINFSPPPSRPCIHVPVAPVFSPLFLHWLVVPSIHPQSCLSLLLFPSRELAFPSPAIDKLTLFQLLLGGGSQVVMVHTRAGCWYQPCPWRWKEERKLSSFLLCLYIASFSRMIALLCCLRYLDQSLSYQFRLGGLSYMNPVTSFFHLVLFCNLCLDCIFPSKKRYIRALIFSGGSTKYFAPTVYVWNGFLESLLDPPWSLRGMNNTSHPFICA